MVATLKKQKLLSLIYHKNGSQLRRSETPRCTPIKETPFKGGPKYVYAKVSPEPERLGSTDLFKDTNLHLELCYRLLKLALNFS